MHWVLRTIVSPEPKIGRTLRRIKKCTVQENTKDQQGGTLYIEFPQIDQMAEEINKGALKDFALSGCNCLQTSITQSTANANNCKIKPTLIQIVK